MRIRVPGRCIAALAILTAFLSLLPANTHVAVAKPIGWNDFDPPPPSGDNDGVVLKARSLYPISGGEQGTVGTKQVTTSRITPTQSLLRNLYFAVMRMNSWSFWLR